MSYHRLQVMSEQVSKLVSDEISVQDRFWKPMFVPSTEKTAKLVADMGWTRGKDSKAFDMTLMMQLLNLDNEGTEDEDSEAEPLEKMKQSEKGVGSMKEPKAKRKTKSHSTPQAETSLQSATKVAKPNYQLPPGILPTDRAEFVKTWVKYNPSAEKFVEADSKSKDLVCLDYFCVEFKKKEGSSPYLGDRFKVYNQGNTKPQSYYEFDEEIPLFKSICKKGWHQRNIDDFPFNWPIREAQIEGCHPFNSKLRVEVEGSFSYLSIMKNTIAVVLGGDVPVDDKRREFRIVLNGKKKCDHYFINKYGLGPDSFRYWERIMCQRQGKQEAGELVPGAKDKCPFVVEEGADAYDAKEQTYKVTWRA